MSRNCETVSRRHHTGTNVYDLFEGEVELEDEGNSCFIVLGHLGPSSRRTHCALRSTPLKVREITRNEYSTISKIVSIRYGVVDGDGPAQADDASVLHTFYGGGPSLFSGTLGSNNAQICR